jgi:hypothetical protein
MQELTERFIDALHRLHTDDDVEPMVALYAEDAQLSKLGQQHHQRGQEGARRFWRTYRDVFDEIEATFVYTVRDEDSAALEWTSTGTLREGGPISYAGVSVLVGQESIAAFRTYYDSAPFLNDQA